MAHKNVPALVHNFLYIRYILKQIFNITAVLSRIVITSDKHFHFIACKSGYDIIPFAFLVPYSFVEVKPAINQVETHIFQQQKTAHEYMEKYGVQHESWGPFAEGRNDFFTNPVLNEIGKKHGKSAAQVALRFLLQSDVVVIPKSTHKERMEENINVFDFALDASDMNAIRALDEKESLFFSHYDPAIAEMMIKHLSCLDLRSRII